MPTFMFSKFPDKEDETDVARVTVNLDSGYLPEVLGGITDFLRACGFNFDGEVGVVPFNENLSK